MNKLTGLIAAPFTPFREDGSIHLPQIEVLVEHLIAQQIKGVFICGSTGEGPSMTVEERMQVAEAFVNLSDKRLFTFVHVGHNSLAEARKLAAHAQQIGADAISATVPTYFKINTVEALIKSLGEIAEGAPDLPLYYYNIPGLTGANLDMVEFLMQVTDHLPTLAGIKYTAPWLHEYQACLNTARGKYDVLYGTDEMLLSALAVGAKGFIGSTYNFAAPIYHQVRTAFEQGDLITAQQYQAQAVEIVRIILRYSALSSQKAIMKMIGLDCGPVRLPLSELSNSQKAALRQDLEEIGFFEQIKSTIDRK
jgi:N-acetylneuraminate lyase